MSESTIRSYRKYLDLYWRPHLAKTPLLRVRYSELVKIADKHKAWSKKTYNNALCVLRRAFAFGFRDHPFRADPARALKSARITRCDRPRIDPFRIQDAEALIAALHEDWGEAQGNYDEFRFFTGLRPSEQIALSFRDLDLAKGTLWISKSKVCGVLRDSTKTGQDRLIRLCPRALAIAQRQLALYWRLREEGLIRHNFLFFTASGDPIEALVDPAAHWRSTLRRLSIRYRRPYCARHSSVSWNLMLGKNPLFVSRQHGHSVETMWRVYSAWMDGAVESDIELIEAAMNNRSTTPPMPPDAPPSNESLDYSRFRDTHGFGNRFANGEGGSSPKWMNENQKKWRRGWDSKKIQ